MKFIDFSRNVSLLIDGTNASLQVRNGKGVTTTLDPSLEEVVRVGARALGWECRFFPGSPKSKIQFFENRIFAIKGGRTCAPSTSLDGRALVGVLARVANARLSLPQ